MASPSFDIRLIPEFNGNGDVVEWISKVEMVCQLQTPPADELIVIPLRLTGGASAVYRQLSVDERKDIQKVKSALKRAFAADKFISYEMFIDRKLRDGESVDVYLAELKQLASLFGGLSEDGLSCALMAGLPDAVKQMLRAGARMESLTLTEIVERVRAILREEQTVQGASAVLEQPQRAKSFACSDGFKSASRSNSRPQRNMATASSVGRSNGQRKIQCYCCAGWGHIAAQCPSKFHSGNGEREEERAPASSRV